MSPPLSTWKGKMCSSLATDPLTPSSQALTAPHGPTVLERVPSRSHSQPFPQAPVLMGDLLGSREGLRLSENAKTTTRKQPEEPHWGITMSTKVA